MWAWLTALTRATTDGNDGYPARTERQAKVTRAEITRLFAKELSRNTIRR